MHASYHDIISRISTAPIWFDEHAVPRYCAFVPRRSASIHIGEIAPAEITRQECQRKFHVALSPVNFRDRTIADAICSRTLHYGDPPRHMAIQTILILRCRREHEQRTAPGDRILAPPRPPFR